MTKNVLQDMVRKTPQRIYIKEKKIEIEKEEIPISIRKKDKNTNKKSKYRLFFVAFISVLFLLFALSFLFSGAKITIIPKVENMVLSQENLSADKNSNASGLSFDLVVISGEENKTIQGGETQDVSVAAKGIVLIYNAFSSSPQAFDVDTRLEGSNGKIYKTVKKIIVPGMTKDNKPGSVEVGIYGAEKGDEYNSSPLDFKILGLKGTPKYSKFYGRSKGDIIAGFKGKVPMISSLDKATVVSELKTTLEAKLLKKATGQIPEGFILFKDAIFLNIDEKNVNFIPDKDQKVLVSIKGTLYGFLLNEKKLTKKIAQDIIEGYDESEIYIPNIRDLTFSLTDKENISFADVKNINFTLAGTPRIIWKVDETKLVTDILSKKKKDFNQILLQYPNINTAELIIRPFWKTSFPDKSKNIQIIVNYPK